MRKREVAELSTYDLLTIRFIDQRKVLASAVYWEQEGGTKDAGACYQQVAKATAGFVWFLNTISLRDAWRWVWFSRNTDYKDDSRWPQPQLWQFIIWLRQACVFVLTASLELFLDNYVEKLDLTNGAKLAPVSNRRCEAWTV